MTKIKSLATLRTSGNGLWSKHVADVDIIDLEVTQTIDEETHTWGELRVYFKTAGKNSWSVPESGLIYTDPLWEKMLKDFLKSQGFSDLAAEDVGYSEAGMQGRNYVSLDVSKDFLKEIDPLINFVNKQEIRIPIKLEKFYLTD